MAVENSSKSFSSKIPPENIPPYVLLQSTMKSRGAEEQRSRGDGKRTDKKSSRFEGV
jgi:hypothetical protein